MKVNKENVLKVLRKIDKDIKKEISIYLKHKSNKDYEPFYNNRLDHMISEEYDYGIDQIKEEYNYGIDQIKEEILSLLREDWENTIEVVFDNYYLEEIFNKGK